MIRDPMRLSESSGDETEASLALAAAIRGARTERASGARVQRIEQRIELALRAAATQQLLSPGRSGRSFSATATVLKALSGAALLALTLALIWAALTHQREPPAPVAHLNEHAPAAPLPAAEQPPHPTPPAPSERPPRPLPPAAAARSDRQTHKPEAKTAGRKRSAGDAAVRGLDEHVKGSPAPDAELALLQRSHAALERDARAALALATEHLRVYPDGVFSEEREMLAIEALHKLQRKPEALARAKAFVARYPHSTHVRRLRAWLDQVVVPRAEPSP